MIETWRIASPDLDGMIADLRAVDAKMPRALAKVHRQIGALAAKSAKLLVKSKTGALKRSIKAQGTQKQANVFINKGGHLAYGAVQEYGYHVGWVSRKAGGSKVALPGKHMRTGKGKPVRVPIKGGYRMMSHALIQVKHYNPEGWILGPAVRTRTHDMEEVYAREIEALFGSSSRAAIIG